jgi:hypothetical protein
LGDGLQTAPDDPLQVVTTVAGRVVRQEQALHVNEVLEIPGDIDFSSGNIDAVIDVHVAGDIKPKFVVKTTKSLMIRGSVEGAELNVGGDVQVRGGLFGQAPGCRIEAEGDVVVEICDDADLETHGVIRISKELINSRLHTTGELLVEHGSVIGGEAYARGGIRVKQAGNEAQIPTRLAVGADGAALHRAEKIKARVAAQEQKARKLRSTAQARLAKPTSLSLEQGSQVSELLASASELERVVTELVAERNQILKDCASVDAPAIHVEGTLHQGVVVVFGLLEARIDAPIKGPLRVEERRTDGITEIVRVNRLTEAATPLVSSAVDVARFETDG